MSSDFVVQISVQRTGLVRRKLWQNRCTRDCCYGRLRIHYRESREQQASSSPNNDSRGEGRNRPLGLLRVGLSQLGKSTRRAILPAVTTLWIHLDLSHARNEIRRFAAAGRRCSGSRQMGIILCRPFGICKPKYTNAKFAGSEATIVCNVNYLKSYFDRPFKIPA